MSYIRFNECGTSPSGKTRRWEVVSRSNGALLGKISWEGGWRQYIFEPTANTIWSDGCLQSVLEFIRSANADHKDKVRKAGK